jgi:flagellar hook-length control protein FliK
MNLSALPELLLAWVKNQGAGLLQGDKPQSATFQPGQQYEGKVVDHLASGRHLVKVADQLLDMNLPTKTQPGDTVRLTYLNAGPRPTFLLNQAAVSPVQQVHISNTAQQVNSLLRLAQSPAISAQASALPLAPAPSSVSVAPASTQPITARAAALPPEAGKPVLAATSPATAPTTPAAAAAKPIAANVLMLQSFTAAVQPMTTALTGLNSGLLGQAVDAPRASIPASTTLSANTLVEFPAASRHMLPVRLSQTVSESGLFYESHLAKWSRGTLTLETLQREPQARLGQENLAAPRLAELGGMPEEAARLAGRQLQMLEGAPFLWQGPAWPGQMMDWLVRQENGGQSQGEAGESASEWVTELKLTLPRMGGVHAKLGLSGEQIRLQLTADTADTRAKLEAALPILAKGFAQNGLQPVDLQVASLTPERLHGAA